MAITSTPQGIPIVGPILNKIIGSRNDRFVKRYLTRVAAINALEAETRRLTDAQLAAKVQEFRQRVTKGAKVDDLMVEAFAVAREAMDRAVGIRNIFNPRFSFDPKVLSPGAQEIYARVKAEMDAREPAPPVGEFLGCPEPQPGWMQVEIPVELYEAVREAYPESRPPYRARPFDVQLIGGMVLSGGKIAEMRTGEGKTIVAPLAAYLACIDHLKVHVVTVNDYLVQRDRDWTFPYFHALGLTVGAIHPQHQQDEDEKRQMYRCDVVYGTTAEFGFDYLRDNMKRSVEQQVQRRREFAIVDEVDSILIDEARTPLIISGPAHDDQPRYDLADRLARHLVAKQAPWQEADDRATRCKMRIKGLEGDIRNTREQAKVPELQAELKQARAELPAIEAEKAKLQQYYEVQLDRKSCHLTHDGVAEAQRAAAVGSFYVDQNMDLPHLLEQALRAHAVYQIDKDYVIMNAPDPMTGKVQPTIVIVDTFTGRPMVGRQWSDGLHQAIEAKEKVPIKQETQTVATITIQNFFKMYKRLAGMTGTADTEAQEFHDIYKLDVVSIPTNKLVIRRDFDDMMFLTAKDKWSFIVDEIKTFHDAGRPILVGTTSVEKSESLSKMLTSKHGIKHEVLNAKQHEREAHIVENAGQLGAVMIATNMAGRGTDIKLGRVTREALLDHWLRRGLAPRTVTVESSEQELREGVFRKIAPKELGLPKAEVEAMPADQIELRLLRHWANGHTWLSPKKIDGMEAEALRKALDESGRFLLHRLRWFESMEDMGGLHVIGTERHEARRIDNQLRGRSGRQGDKGSSRFFVSLEDELMKLFAGETTMRILSRLGMKEGDAIEHPMLSKSMERAQRKVEERNFQIRKNILDYDEVMEHQRQRFYGLRQRVLEGRDVKGLILEYIEDAIDDACAEYLDKEYPAVCAAEYAKQAIECSIAPDRLRGKELHEMDQRIREEAKAEARHMVAVTLGEFMPAEGSEIDMDFDPTGLIAWAKSRFGVDLDPAALHGDAAQGRRHVERTLVAAAEARINEADLSGLVTFVQPNYGVQQLCAWADKKFGIAVTPEELLAAQQSPDGSPAAVLMDKARAVYRRREIEDPVDFAIQMTMQMSRQSVQQAAAQLVSWANRRYNLNWTVDVLRTTTPQNVRNELLAASKQFVESGALDNAITEALKQGDDESLDRHLTEKYGIGLPDWMRHMRGQEREDAIRGRVENMLRTELLHFERTVLLETFDDTWRNHLYSMDQLRDGINFRAFSQQDPRIEFKREGSRMFQGMLQTVRDRLTDYIFKVRITPQLNPPPMPAGPMPGPMGAGAPQPPRIPAGVPGNGGPPPPPMGMGGTSITGPGF
jgi:preprotein translocase subunit SecA